MDKNFMNVDNLVKQRLGGGEEAERSGAWQNMRELLDKEMPQEKPLGMLYWRRMLSAVALVLLVGTIGVGGYKMATSASSNNDAVNTTVATVAAPAPGIQTGTSVNDNAVSNPASTTAATDNEQQNDPANYNEGNNKQLMVTNEDHTTNENSVTNKETNTQKANKQLSVPKPTGNTNPANDRIAVNDNKNIDKRMVNGNNVANNTTVVNDKQAGSKSTVTADNRQATANTVPANNDKVYTKTTNKEASKGTVSTDAAVKNNRISMTPTAAIAKTNVPASGDNKATDSKAKATLPTAKAAKPVNTDATVANVSNTKQGNVNKESKTGIAVNNNNPASAKNNTKATAANSNNPVAAKRNTKAATANNNSAVAGNTDAKAAKNNVAKTNADKKQTISPDKMALSSHAPSEKNISGVSAAGKVIDAKNKTGKENNVANAKDITNASGTSGSKSNVSGDKNGIAKNNTSTTSTSVPMFVTKSGKKIPGDKLQRLNLDKAKKNKNASAMSAINPLTSKRVIQKMALVEHLVTSPTGEKSYKLDTVSMVTLTEELGIITETKTTIPVNNSHTTGNGNSTTKNQAIAAPAPVPASSAKSHTSITSEESAPARMGTGTKSMENLTAAFNDVKYHVAGMQFASGITAGINGTFFGPNSFKGFQFGFAGSFIFSEKVSLMAELKYFHRINNNYDINDNYYTYTPANGGYNKELQQNSYTFSTLHSFEFPLAICYTEKKFNFFAGGNFVYSFAINTGAASQADPNNITATPTIGNDNAPRLKEQDFNSRFGMGYLFGASYKVSPNVLIDVRNVQTLWDNSRSAGAKEVSSQLYRSPSIQISFDYRLGRNNRKE